MVLGLLSVGFAQAEKPSPMGTPAKVVVIPIREQIAKPELFILRRGLKEAIENKVDTIVLDMETPGGDLETTFEMLKALEKFPGKTVTYVNREAISAGALISAGTDEIHFAPGGVIGAAAPVLVTGGEIDETMRGKIVSYLKARMRSISEGKGYRGEVISAMIDMDYELKIGDEVIKAKGELLSLTAQEAMKSYGDPPRALLGSGIADNLDALLDGIHGAGNYSVTRLEITWSEKLAQYLTALTPILMGLGLVCLFIEFKTPGFGIFGISGLTLLAIVFFGQFVAGLSGHEPILFFLLGVILLVIELFFFPGSMVLGLTGAAMMLGSLVWAMTDLWPGEPIPLSGDVFVRPLLNMMAGVIVATLLFLAILKFLPKGGLWGHMVLEASVAGEPVAARAIAGGGSDEPRASVLIGETGFTATGLFPSGQVEIGGRRYEARLAMGYADAGTPVKVTGLAEFGLIVEVLS
jgi:membrane-bound serine protease (ClpP class)